MAINEQDDRTAMTSGVPGLKPLAVLFTLGVCAMVGALIAFGWIAFDSLESTKLLRPLVERGERVSGVVLSSEAAESESYVVEYDLNFEEEARREVIYARPGVDAAGRFRVEAGGPPKPVELCFDPLDPANVTFADTLDEQVTAALAHQNPWKRGAWIALLCGLLLSACTFLPMKRLANAHGVPLVHYRDFSEAQLPPAEFGKHAGLIGAVGGLFVIFVSATIYMGSQRYEALASRGVPIRGEVIESFADPQDDDDPFRFKVSYSLSGEGPRLERTLSVLGGISAPRFEVEPGQTREVDLVIDPEDPKVVGFGLSLAWDLEDERHGRSFAAWTLAISAAWTFAAAWLYAKCRRSLLDSAPVRRRPAARRARRPR